MGNRLTTYIKKVCANWDNNGCLGATIMSNGLFNTSGKCQIMNGKPCEYFEECVLPSAKKEENYGKILKCYIKINPKMRSLNLNTCNDCNKIIPPRKRYCKKCAIKRRKSTYKISSKRSRYHVNSYAKSEICRLPITASLQDANFHKFKRSV
jgi:hypothetical protein